MPNAILQRCIDDQPPRAKSLIVTVYGDALLPYGGQCWLGDLIDLVAPLGLNERVTRTAVFRLVQDGTLEAERVGRRSRYALTRIGRRRFDSAQARIYATEPPERDGQWTLIVLPDALAAPERDALVQALAWQGFARLSPGLLGAARGDAVVAAREVLEDLSLSVECSLFTAHASDGTGLAPLAARAWPLEEIAADYALFLERFTPLAMDVAGLDGESAFIARILLIHAYRRTLLRDPALPDDLLPPDWAGHAARRLARSLYRALLPRSQAHLEALLDLRPSPGLAERFK